MTLHYKRIGDYVTQVKLKNTDGAISSLKGININKHFMPSVANINGTDLSTYRVVKKNQFAFNPMHVGRDEVLPIALLEDDEPAIVSPAYIVFEVNDEQELLPAYLMMWCSRSEFDRNAWFMTDNSVRGGFSWNDFCEMKLPIPSIEKQREIVREYNVVNDRIVLNEQLIQKLEDTAQTIYKQWFVDFEFPISKEYAESIGKSELEGQPYKSSGGQMRSDVDLEDYPINWMKDSVDNLTIIRAGGDRPKVYSSVKKENYTIPIYSNSTENRGLYGWTNEAKILEECITISARGGIGFTVLRDEPFVPIVRLIVVQPKMKIYLNYLYQFFKNYNYDSFTTASAQAQLTSPNVASFCILRPDHNSLESYDTLTTFLNSFIKKNQLEIQVNEELRMILLSKLAKA